MPRDAGARGPAEDPNPLTGAPLARLAAVSVAIAELQGWRRWATAFVAGAASILALPPFFLWPILALTLPVLIWLTGDDHAGPSGSEVISNRSAPILRAGVAGWLFGYGFHVAGLYWLREAFLITGGGLGQLWPLGVLGLPAGLALFHGLATAAAFAVSRPGLQRVLALAITLSATEWLRGNILTGFPWNVLGMAITWPLPLMQASGLLGIYGLTAITVLALAGPGVVLGSDRRLPSGPGRFATATALAVLPLGALAAYGAWRLSIPVPAMIDGVRLRLVQPSIDQRDKWRAEKQPDILARHLELTGMDATGRPDGLSGITHVVWPEAAMPFLPLQRPNVLAAIADRLPDGVHLLSGIVRIERSGTGVDQITAAYNSLAVLDGEGRPIAVYDKTHLVPFGEYLPFQGLLEAVGLETLTRQRGGFTPGRTPRPLLDVGALTGIGPLICYEGIFPGVGRRSAGRPSVLLNVTNDGWFGNSTGPRQHLHQARLRSIEEGLPLVRVANNGISGVFDPFGRELARLELNVAGVLDTGLPGAVAPPVYGRIGDWAFAVVLLGLLLAYWYSDKRIR